jgi:hypothetical protein
MTIVGWIYWIVYQLLSLVFEIVGFVLLIPFAAFGLWTTRPGKSPLFSGRTVTAWVGGWLMQPWDNEEDGVVPPALVNGQPYMSGKSDRLRAYVWSAWRNPTSGMKILPGASFKCSDNVKVTIKPWGYIASDGWRPCLAYKFIRIGWVINPDAQAGWRSWPTLENWKP